MADPDLKDLCAKAEVWRSICDNEPQPPGSDNQEWVRFHEALWRFGRADPDWEDCHGDNVVARLLAIHVAPLLAERDRLWEVVYTIADKGMLTREAAERDVEIFRGSPDYDHVLLSDVRLMALDALNPLKDGEN